MALHADFGNLLRNLRQKAGIAQQMEFAKMMEVTQQTISRWEAGHSRPRAYQISLLANVLKTDINELLAAAKYDMEAISAVASFDQPFPVYALNPYSFERFCCEFLTMKYPEAKVHLFGGHGHKQHGIDIEALFPNEDCYTFQCKRVEEFGPAKVKEAVKKHEKKATKNYLLLTRTASPQAREEIKRHPNWDIWDLEDISREIRKLSKDDQRKLVDRYFRAHRLALLGETESGPWQTAKEFFEVFTNKDTAYNHEWKLVGGNDETQAIIDGLLNSNIRVVLLVGAVGSGKSRILKQAIELYEADNKKVTVHFLSPSQKITNKSLEDLGDKEKVIVIDGAHDKTDLDILFQYVAKYSNKATFLLSSRQYELGLIKSQAANFALAGENIREIKIEPLALEQSIELAKQVLEKFHGPIIMAEIIAKRTISCPLETVMAAQIISQENTYFDLAKNNEVFKQILRGKFQETIIGEIGAKTDHEPLKKLLKIISLLQPLHPEDISLINIIQKVEGIDAITTQRLFRLLIDAGVLFERRSQYWISPGALADFILEDECIGVNGASTGYAEKVFDVVNLENPTYLTHLLLNLGKLDWRIFNGDPNNSQFLNGIWAKLNPCLKDNDPHIRAVTAVAYYQPGRALEFAENLIRKKECLYDLPTLIEHAAYNLQYLQQACECLWELGKSDNRMLNQYPEHAIRLLKELCSVKPGRSIDYNSTVVEFGISLLNKDDSWKYKYTPFDFLKGILETEVKIIREDNNNLSISSFSINHSFIAPLREKVINAVINLLSNKNSKISIKAAEFLETCLKAPMEADADSSKVWKEEFLQTMYKIENNIRDKKIETLPLLKILHFICWYAEKEVGEIALIAQRIKASVPASLEFRATLILAGFPSDFFNSENPKAEGEKYVNTLISEILSTYPKEEELYDFIEQRLICIGANFVQNTYLQGYFYSKLLDQSSQLTEITLKKTLKSCRSQNARFAYLALSKLLKENRVLGLKYVRDFLDSDTPNLHIAVASAYESLHLLSKRYDKDDITLLQRILASPDENIKKAAIKALQTVAGYDKKTALYLLKCVDIGTSDILAEEIFYFFHREEMISFSLLNREDIDFFLRKLLPLSQFGYWVGYFLSMSSKEHAKVTLNFFIKRVENAISQDDWNYRIYSGIYPLMSLRFRESLDLNLNFRQIREWVQSKEEKNNGFQQFVAELFNMVFQPFDNEIISLLQSWVNEAASSDIEVISQIFSLASPNFVFEHQSFVSSFLEKAEQYGVMKKAIDALSRPVIQQIRSGIVGEPFEQDIQLKEKAEQKLSETSRFSPIYLLYKALKNFAELSIKHTLKKIDI
jgi:transcriptional regulator with XRE-family HTH domain